MTAEGLLSGRERVLSLVWLVGALLTAATLVLPYDIDITPGLRWAVLSAASVTSLALWLAPPLPDAVLHGVLVAGQGLIALCTHHGVPEVEGVIFALPVVFAFGAFPLRAAWPHLLLAAALYALVLADGTAGAPVGASVPWVMVMGVTTCLSLAVSWLVEDARRSRAAGARDHRIAAVLQRTLLPEELPAVPGIAIAARYVPAADEADVGGDLYDALPLPDGRLAIAIGDVAGKGLAAAVLAGRVRSALRAYAHDDPRPSVVLGRLNRLLDQGEAAPLVTLSYAVLDPARHELRWASAGHLPPLVLGPDGLAEYGPVTGDAPLAAVPGADFAEQTVTVAPGDRILVFTDGLVERRGAGLADALEHVRRVAAGAPADAGALVEAALAAPRGGARDDVAVLAVAVSPSRDRAALRT